MRRIIAAALFGAAVSGMIYAISQTVGYRQFLEIQNAIDDHHAVHSGRGPARDPRIAVIDIDDASLRALGDFRQWPRRHFAAVIDRVNADGARLVFLDVILLEGSTAPDNEALVLAASKKHNVILGYYFNIDREDGRRRPRDPVYNERFAARWVPGGHMGRTGVIRAENAKFSYPELVHSAAGMGFTNYIPDPDGVLRHIPLYIEHDGEVYPSAALRMWLRTDSFQSGPARITPRGVEAGGALIPADAHGFMRLNFGNAEARHPMISFADVIDGRFPAGTFTGKVVMIGSGSSQLGDLKRVPGHAALPGVEIHAVALSTMLGRDFLSVVPGDTVLLITVLCGVLVSILFAFFPPFVAGVPAALAVPPVLYSCSVYRFVLRGELLNIAVPSAAALFAGLVLTLYFLLGRAERRRQHHARENGESRR